MEASPRNALHETSCSIIVRTDPDVVRPPNLRGTIGSRAEQPVNNPRVLHERFCGGKVGCAVAEQPFLAISETKRRALRVPSPFCGGAKNEIGMVYDPPEKTP